MKITKKNSILQEESTLAKLSNSLMVLSKRKYYFLRSTVYHLDFFFQLIINNILMNITKLML